LSPGYVYYTRKRSTTPRDVTKGCWKSCREPLRDKDDKAKNYLKTLPRFYDSGKRGQRVQSKKEIFYNSAWHSAFHPHD